MKKILCLFLILILTLSGCGQKVDPPQPVIPTIPQDLEPVPSGRVFQNADGTAKFTWSVGEVADPGDLPTLTVTPHLLTAEDARQVGQVLFPGGNFLERGPEYSPPDWYYTKDSLAEDIARWKQYTTPEKMQELFGGTQYLEMMPMEADGTEIPVDEYIQEFIADREELLSRLPEGDNREPCRWTLRKEEEYRWPAEECRRMDLSQDDDALQALVEWQGRDYFFFVLLSGEGGGRLDRMGASLYGGMGPLDVDSHILRAELLRTPEPTKDQIDKAEEQALALAEKIGMGSWKLAETKVDNIGPGSVQEYLIRVRLSPKTVSAIPEDMEILNAAYPAMGPQMDFAFAPGGELYDFRLDLPIEDTAPQAETSDPLVPETLLSLAARELETSGVHTFGCSSYTLMGMEDGGVPIDAEVEVKEGRYGYLFLESPAGDRQYVPALILYGTAQYLKAGQVLAQFPSASQETPDQIPLMAVTVPDGICRYFY